MDKIFSYEPGIHCALTRDALVTFFQMLSDDMSTEKMVSEFLIWLDTNNLTLTGKKIIFKLKEDTQVSSNDINALHQSFLNSPLEPMTVIIPPTFDLTFETPCSHLQRFHSRHVETEKAND